MTTVLVISIIILMLGIAGMIICTQEDYPWWIFCVSTIIVIVSWIIVVGTIFSLSKRQDSVKSKEFPASRYELKLRVTEFEGQKDTTYVLIPKEQ